MPTISTQALGPTDARIMAIARSSSEPLTVCDVHIGLAGDVADTTVMTVMERLAEKGLLIRALA
jgi:predicted transcriptional regulator